MGYQTRYRLELEGNSDEIDFLKLEFVHISTIEPRNYYIKNLLQYDEHEAKWYDHENDLKELSINYPLIFFRLYGIGENWGDFWVKYFKNGKMTKLDCILSPDNKEE